MNYQQGGGSLETQFIEAIEMLNTVFYELANKKLSSMPVERKLFLMNIIEELSIIFDPSFNNEVRQRAQSRIMKYVMKDLEKEKKKEEED